MNSKAVIFLGCALAALPGLTVAADDGEKIYATICAECHTPKKQPLDKLHLNRAEWSEAVERMVSYGAEIPKGKLPELLDYLVRSHGSAGAAGEGKK